MPGSDRIVDRVATVILGGGRGTRLFPLTQDRAKPAINFGAKYRLIDIPISNSINSGIRKIFVLTQFLSAGLHRHITRTYRLDNFSDGFVEILAAEQTHTKMEWFQGTADAVRRSLRYLLRAPVQHYLILAGDQLYRFDFRSMLASHLYHDADVTLAATLIPRADVPRMGILRCDPEGRVIEAVEKPEDPEVIGALEAPLDACARFTDEDPGDRRHIGSMGIYIFRRRALISLLEESVSQSFAAEIIPSAIESLRVFSHPFDGYWVDVGTIRSYYDANLELTDPAPRLNLYQGESPIFTRHRSLPASKIVDCHVERAIVGEGSIVEGATLSRALIGLRSVVGRGSVIRNSILLGNDHMEGELDSSGSRPEIGENVTIENAIIDKNVSIGNNVRIASHQGVPDQDHELYHVRDGLVIVLQGVKLPEGMVIEP